jgi:hypothetical protein
MAFGRVTVWPAPGCARRRRSGIWCCSAGRRSPAIQRNTHGSDPNARLRTDNTLFFLASLNILSISL